ncbi:hypothetical protein [Flavobacterium piscis]|uniref:Lipoprotein n=1 Tax=Flavobacterium piscis TaxID=1114874 RepID=A0ABU1YBJ2_9FLAO|nr:hypothetical protein [Flavobacterium piscis]MDR7211458.1 hypothetical protein [Flavobacterium piscis]
MIKKTYLIASICLLFSCGTGLRVSQRNFEPIDKDFSKSFINQSFKTSKSIAAPINGPKLLSLFGISNSEAEMVTLTFKNNNLLDIIYKDSSITKTLTFEVKHARKGYLEISAVHKNIQIPPIIPFLYSNVDLKRTRIGFTTNNELIIDHKWEKSGSFLLFMGGAGGRTLYFFKSSNKQSP